MRTKTTTEFFDGHQVVPDLARSVYLLRPALERLNTVVKIGEDGLDARDLVSIYRIRQTLASSSMARSISVFVSDLERHDGKVALARIEADDFEVLLCVAGTTIVAALIVPLDRQNRYAATIHARDGGSSCGAALEARVPVVVDHIRVHLGLALRVIVRAHGRYEQSEPTFATFRWRLEIRCDEPTVDDAKWTAALQQLLSSVREVATAVKLIDWTQSPPREEVM